MGIPVYSAAVLVCLLGFCSVVQPQYTIERTCDPHVAHRFDEACPDGYCCVRDEFMPSWVYCKRMGALHEGCTTRDTETNCPCIQGMYCHPNIVSSSGTASLYGKCDTTPHCPHGHSCEHHHSHATHVHGHHTVDPAIIG